MKENHWKRKGQDFRLKASNVSIDKIALDQVRKRKKSSILRVMDVFCAAATKEWKKAYAFSTMKIPSQLTIVVVFDDEFRN